MSALLCIRLEKLSAGCKARTAYVMPAFDTLPSAPWEEQLDVSEWAMSSESDIVLLISSHGGED